MFLKKKIIKEKDYGNHVKKKRYTTSSSVSVKRKRQKRKPALIYRFSESFKPVLLNSVSAVVVVVSVSPGVRAGKNRGYDVVC